jgi:hypothetical protein
VAKYLVLYRSTMSAEEQMSQNNPEQGQAGMDAWMAWAQQASDAIVDLGAPLRVVESTNWGSESATACDPPPTNGSSPCELTRLSPLVLPGLLVRRGRRLVSVDLNEHNMMGRRSTKVADALDHIHLHKTVH